VRAVSSSPAARRAGLAILATLAVACSREPLDAGCPELGPGELVVTEVRGPQRDDGDAFGQWIELYNGSGAALDLAGLRVSIRKLDGSGQGGFIVRAAAEVAAGGFAVLGGFPAGAEPAYVDFGYLDELSSPLYATAAIDVSSCGQLIDRVIYHGLPDFGTYALDGALAPPDADANDDDAGFCVDDRLDDADPSAGPPGTPGATNPPCP
jgi:hypothetical protein